MVRPEHVSAADAGERDTNRMNTEVLTPSPLLLYSESVSMKHIDLMATTQPRASLRDSILNRNLEEYPNILQNTVSYRSSQRLMVVVLYLLSALQSRQRPFSVLLIDATAGDYMVGLPSNTHQPIFRIETIPLNT